MLFNLDDIFETTRMITEHNLDVRTITMGISLRDCCHPDINVTAQKVYDKICTKAEKLVRTGEDIEAELGVPIINKRISVTPISMVGESCTANDYVPLARALDKAGKQDVVVYMGNKTKSTSKKISDGITLTIDGVAQTIISKNHELAGFGVTGQNGRTGYMFNQLGQYDLAAGEHTITISGKSSEVYNVAVINLINL